MSNIRFLHDVETLNAQLKDHLASAGAGTIFVLTDKHIQELGLPDNLDTLREATHIIVPAGEDSKSLVRCQQIWDSMLQAGADKDSILINLGGGMVSDLGGFAASVFKRGIRFINIPTTLLAMTDAAIGGKTGINFHTFKNQIGNITPAESIFICPDYLTTLPEIELLSGFAEVCKYGLIGNKALWKSLKGIDTLKNNEWLPTIIACVNDKLKIAAQDLQEMGPRKTLNFGHTIGHALESLGIETGTPLTHGHAVALGMVAEAYLSMTYCKLPEIEFQEIKVFLQNVYPAAGQQLEQPQRLLEYMRQDKKNKDNRIKFALLEYIGTAVYDITCGEEDILHALKHLFSKE